MLLPVDVLPVHSMAPGERPVAHADRTTLQAGDTTLLSGRKARGRPSPATPRSPGAVPGPRPRVRWRRAPPIPGKDPPPRRQGRHRHPHRRRRPLRPGELRAARRRAGRRWRRTRQRGARLLRRHRAGRRAARPGPVSSGTPWDIATKQAAAAVGQPHLMAAWGEALGAHGLHGGPGAPHRRRPGQPQALPERAPHLRAAARARRRAGGERERHRGGRRDQGRRQRQPGGAGGRLRRGRPGGHAHRRGGALRPRPAHAGRAAAPRRAPGSPPRWSGWPAAPAASAASAAWPPRSQAAKRLAAQGVGTALLSGRRPGALAALLAGEPVGHLLPRPRRSGAPAATGLAHRSRPGRKGTILVDAGARRALAEQGKSLLPSRRQGGGGPLRRRRPGRHRGRPASHPFARGLAGYGADEVRRHRRARRRARSRGCSAIKYPTRWSTGTTWSCTDARSARRRR